MGTVGKHWLAAVVIGLALTSSLLAEDDDRAATGCGGIVLDPNDPNSAHFTRAGRGFLGGPDGLHAYDADEMRRKWEISCSAGRIEILTGDLHVPGDPNGYDATPWCVTSGPAGQFLWATRPAVSGQYTGLWRTAGGSNWEFMGRIGNASSGGYAGEILSMYALRSGRLIAFGHGGDIGFRRWTAWWRDANGPWIRALDPNGQNVLLGGVPYYIHNICEAPPREPGQSDGTIIAVTYLGVDDSTVKQIWRSGDAGQHWERVWQGGLAPVFRHFHSVVYHQASDQWLVDTGDGDAAHGHTYASTDDGRTWHEWWLHSQLANHSSPTGQVTCFRDPGALASASGRVYLGSDSSQRVGWLDVNTWRVGTFMERQYVNRGPDLGRKFEWHVWDLLEFDGVWYATLESSAPAGRQTPVVLVSPDLNRWAVYGRLPSESTFRTFGYCAGLVNGQLHYITACDDWHLAHARVSAARVAEVEGVCISPATTNLLTLAQSTCGSWEAGWHTDAPHDVDSNVPFFADAGGSLHAWKTNLGSSHPLIVDCDPPYPCTVGTKYRFHVWLRGHAKDVSVRVNDVNLAAQPRFGLRADENGEPVWTEIWTPAIAATSSQPRLRVLAWPNEVDRRAELWIGAAAFAATPVDGDWVPGGGESPPERLEFTDLMFGAEWTHLFSSVLLCGTDDLDDSGLSYIRNYRLPAGDSIDLCFDAGDKRFKLWAGSTEVAASAARTLLGGTRVYFAVRQSDGQAHLSVSDGAGIEHASGPMDHLLVGQGSIGTGASDGSGVAAQVLLQDVFYRGCALTDADVESRFSEATLR